MVTGLQPDTTYYFALKVHDEGGNIGDFGNAVMATDAAPDLTPPGQVYNLRAEDEHGQQSVDLTWKASAMTATPAWRPSYDLRYSTSPIDEANWAAATQVTGLPAPKAPGASRDLHRHRPDGGTMYYFALKATDEAPTSRPIATRLCPGQRPRRDDPAAGLNGYFGIKDSYTVCRQRDHQLRHPERSCGSAASAACGLNNIQRGLLSFDVTSIPAGTSILSAKAHACTAANLAQIKGTTGAYGLHPVTQELDRSGACWNNYASGAAWTTAGGDFVRPPMPPPRGTARSQCGWYAFDVTSRVQAWINSPAGNYGWVVKATDEMPSNQDEFASSDYGNADLQPKLVVSDLPPLHGRRHQPGRRRSTWWTCCTWWTASARSAAIDGYDPHVRLQRGRLGRRGRPADPGRELAGVV